MEVDDSKQSEQTIQQHNQTLEPNINNFRVPSPLTTTTTGSDSIDNSSDESQDSNSATSVTSAQSDMPFIDTTSLPPNVVYPPRLPPGEISPSRQHQSALFTQLTPQQALHFRPSHDTDSTQVQHGCSHYQRHCLIRAPCCSTFYPCRLCHNEANAHPSGHDINRHDINEMICMFCAEAGTVRVQPVNKQCQDCRKLMAAYYCYKCRLFDDVNGEDIFHCSDCGICRRGKREAFFHCRKCNCCFSTALLSGHKCIENVLYADCPVCIDKMFESREPVHFLHCGHAMHQRCLVEYAKHDAVCPTCKRSMFAPSAAANRAIQEYLQRHPMPAEYSNFYCEVLCNDCLTKTELQWHFQFHQCANQHCQSFNTDVIRRWIVTLDEIAHSREQQPADAIAVDALQPQQGDVVEGEVVEGEDAAEAVVDDLVDDVMRGALEEDEEFGEVDQGLEEEWDSELDSEEQDEPISPQPRHRPTAAAQN